MAFEISRLGCAEAGVSLCHGMILPCDVLLSLAINELCDDVRRFRDVYQGFYMGFWISVVISCLFRKGLPG